MNFLLFQFLINTQRYAKQKFAYQHVEYKKNYVWALIRYQGQ